MAFHRFAVPVYTGGLPVGYDYINNATSGTPAPADPAIVGGTYAGSYFFEFQGQVTAAHLNRAARALAENCDHLDNLLRRDIATTTLADFIAGGAPVASVLLTGPGIFLGKPGTPNTVAGLATLYSVLDQNDNEILNAGVECKVSAISDTVGNGFSAGNVTLTVTPAIPVGIPYRVYYGTRSNLATLPIDAFTSIKIRGAEEIPADLIAPGGAALVGYAGSGNWADGSAVTSATVETAIDEIVADLAAASGAPKIGATANAASFVFGTSGATVQAQLDELSDYLDEGPRGRRVFTYTSAASPVTLNTTQRQVLADTTAGAITFNLPAASHGREYYFKDPKGTWGTNNITLVPNGLAKIDNAAGNRVFSSEFGSFRIFSDGTDWFID